MTLKERKRWGHPWTRLGSMARLYEENIPIPLANVHVLIHRCVLRSEDGMETRRAVLKSITAIGAAGLPRVVQARNDYTELASDLAHVLSDRYGGDWVFAGCPEDGVLVVCRRV